MKRTGSGQTAYGLSMDVEIQQLNAQAVNGLVPMFDAERQLFCHRLRQSESGLVQEGLSPRYTVMTLLGLHRSEAAGLASPVEIRAVLGSLLQNTSRVNNIGDLGLLLWGCAVIAPERLRETCSTANLPNAFEQSREVREGRTMELAWLLSGLAHARLALSQEVEGLADLARKTYELVRRNQGDSGIFGHLGRNETITGRLRGGIGSFADQVYPIYALSKFAQAYNVKTALEMARNCADAICRVQGSMGQWWWHYHAATGRVAEKYPVYSVHQEGMAPMALFALQEASHLDYSPSIDRGLRWIAGQNELACDLRHNSGLVWRCLHHGSKFKVYLDRASSFLGWDAKSESPAGLRILTECRPYELGWLLYAFAGREDFVGAKDRLPLQHGGSREFSK
jgi:hypothetical protein